MKHDFANTRYRRRRAGRRYLPAVILLSALTLSLFIAIGHAHANSLRQPVGGLFGEAGIDQPEILLATPSTEQAPPVTLDVAPAPFVAPRPALPIVTKAVPAPASTPRSQPTYPRPMRLLKPWTFAGYQYPVGTVLSTYGYANNDTFHDCYIEIAGGCVPADSVVLI